MLFGSKKIVGLDIGTSSIKIAELELGRKGIQLQNFGVTPTPMGAMSGGEVLNAGDLSVAILALLSESRIKTKKACTAMSGNAVIVKKITIPRIDKKAVAEQIRFEAEQYIPFDINEISLAYHILDPGSSTDTMEILLVAAQSPIVGNYMQAISNAGLDSSILDVGGFALSNIYEANYGRNAAENILLINVGAALTTLVVRSGGEVIFSRDIPVGGINYTNEIQKEMGISAGEAESLKLSAVARREVPEEVNTIITNINEGVSDEVRNGYDFFTASTTGVNVTKGFFTGGSSQVTGLMAGISTAIGLPLEPLNPFLRVTYNPKNLTADYIQQISPFAAVALGLGLRKLGDG
jgi:type IV pilus assembly protein PilM